MRHMNKITHKLTLGIFGLLLSIGVVSALGLTTASAAAYVCPASFSASKCDACQGLTQIDTSQDCTNGGSGVTSVIKAVVNILSYIVGAVAVIMVIIAGLKYVTSAGDSNSISSAKSTLIYALVGLAIAALAQIMVHFVLTSAVNATPCPSTVRDSSGKVISGLNKGDALCK